MTALTRYDAARFALQQAASVDEVKDIRDKAQAMAAYAKQAHDTQLVEWATEIKVRAERRAGFLLGELDRKQGKRNDLTSDHDGPKSFQEVIAENDIAPTTAKRWQKLAAVSEDQFEQAVAAAKEVAGEVTTAALLRVANGHHRTNFSGENEWYTPKEYVELARKALGTIDLDPASSLQAQETVRAKAFYSLQDNGLAQEWKGRVWLNPPYAQPEIEHFIDKLVGEVSAGRTSEAILLTHNYTDTAWFHTAAKAAQLICFTRGRIKFQRYDGAVGAPTQGQAFFYFGKRMATFTTVFGEVGFIR